MRRVLIPETVAPELPAPGSRIVTLNGETMGTTWSVRLVDSTNNPNTQDWQLRIQNQLDLVVAQMSHWQEASDLGRFNRAHANSWCTLPQLFFDVLTYALSVAEESDGAYDPTAGALVNTWGFGPSGRYDEPDFQLPSPAAIDMAREVSGWKRLSVDTAERKIRQPGGLLLDLSAVAKGFGVDLVANHLESSGVTHYLVEVGGELRGAGVKPDGQPWWVALEQPSLVVSPESAPAETVVALHGLSIATSGDYRRFYLAGDSHLSHTIDPRSGYPIRNDVASVTVLHSSCMAADALSTALTVLGADDGITFAEQHRLAARFLIRDGSGFSERNSSTFRAMLQ